MRVVRSVDGFPEGEAPVVLVIGAFDGLHLGHRHLLRRGRLMAEGLPTESTGNGGAEVWLTTFDPHPRLVLDPAGFPGRLISDGQRLRVAEGWGDGPDGCWLLPFDEAVSGWSPERFVAALHGSVGDRLAAIVVGRGWRFGKGAAGDVEVLRGLLAGNGVRVEACDLLGLEGGRVSSSRIRRLVKEGKLPEAAALLGRSFALEGTVVGGKREGRTLGFPTANLACGLQVLPPPGIYAARAVIDGEVLGGAGYVPADGGGFEVHFFDLAPEADLYGRVLEVEVLLFLRAHRAFSDVEALKAQIAADVLEARKVVARGTSET